MNKDDDFDEIKLPTPKAYEAYGLTETHARGVLVLRNERKRADKARFDAAVNFPELPGHPDPEVRALALAQVKEIAFWQCYGGFDPHSEVMAAWLKWSGVVLPVLERHGHCSDCFFGPRERGYRWPCAGCGAGTPCFVDKGAPFPQIEAPALALTVPEGTS